MKETLEKLLAVEAECEETKHNARNEARRIKDAATAAGKDLVREKRRGANQRSFEILDTANQNADVLLARVKQEINVEYANLTATAGRNLKKAAERIVERIAEGV